MRNWLAKATVDIGSGQVAAPGESGLTFRAKAVTQGGVRQEAGKE